jgi:pimeloyl-ACP methyl ester carboxylesterase
MPAKAYSLPGSPDQMPDTPPPTNDRPTACLAIANGFPPETYQPLARALAAQLQIISPLPRPLWPDPPPPQEKGLWRRIASDLLAAIRQRDLHDIIGIGHSMGGVFTTMAAVDDPTRFRALILLDPSLLAPPLPLAARATQVLGLAGQLSLARNALHRRATFPSTAAAYDYWKDKPLFADWPAESLHLYAQSMTRPGPDGGVELAWPRAWEAVVYRTYPARPWATIARLRGRMPILVIRGGLSDTFTSRSAIAFRRRAPQAEIAVIEGHGHLFPHTAPRETADVIADWLSRDAGAAEAAAGASQPTPAL